MTDRNFRRRGAPWCLVLAAGTLLFAVPARGEGEGEVHEVEPVVVTAGRTVTVGEKSNRSLSVVSKERIESLPVSSLTEVLEYVPGVDIRSRGPFGVQADISIRGASFEQTLVLVDGVKVSDPQTGHHALDLPLTLDDIERIEVLKGEGSSLYGPNAFGGAVNIITRRPAGKSTRLRAAAGDFGYLQGGAALSLPVGSTGNRIAVDYKRSDGYRHNTDFDIATASYSGVLEGDAGDVSLLLGYTDKQFGANSFYSDRFPNQWEETQTSMMNLSADGGGEAFSLKPVLSWRRHEDRFLLERDDPSFYENRHTTDVYGAELHLLADSRWGRTAVGVEMGGEAIDSSSLGDHWRTRGGLYGEHRVDWRGRVDAALEAFAYHYSDWGWEIWPGFNAGWLVGDRTRLYGSAGRSFRVPSYTELHYVSPANVGNPDLEPEEAWSCELGARWKGNPFSAQLAVFRRESENLIDWVRADELEPWEARNIAQVDTTGFEAGFRYDARDSAVLPFIESFEVGYTYLDSDKALEGVESKYVLDHLRHQVVAGLAHPFFLQARQTWAARYEERLDGQTYFLLDTRLDRKVGPVTWYLDVRNILDEEYTKVEGVPMPGRWFSLGLRADF